MRSFRCGHHSPIVRVIEGIIEKSGTPWFCFRDLDENKPAGSIKIRVETIDYFQRRYREDIIKRRMRKPGQTARTPEAFHGDSLCKLLRYTGVGASARRRAGRLESNASK
jgi:hypothetical protein